MDKFAIFGIWQSKSLQHDVQRKVRLHLYTRSITLPFKF